MGRLCPAHGKLKCRKCKRAPASITIADIQAAAERERRRHSERIARDIYTTGLPPGDCTYPGCQLSAGHPPPHCCVWPSAVMLKSGRPAGYLMIDDNGNVLREL
jgi:hypothetical protein